MGRILNWIEPEIEFVEAAVRPPGKHAQARPLPPSPHGILAGGRQDFRRYPLQRLVGVTMADVDFSRARSPRNSYGVDAQMMLSSVTCDRCAFDQAATLHSVSGTFRDCSFRKIKTAGAGLCGIYERCDFTEAKLTRARLAANFRECCFNGADLRLVSWYSSFLNCTFAGVQIDDLRAHIREFVQSGEPVTFSVSTSGRIRPGVVVHV